MWTATDGDKAFARNQAYLAAQCGRLRRPERCSECGATGRIEGHHPDYSRPLHVEWLCVSCHRRADAHKPRPRKPRASVGVSVPCLMRPEEVAAVIGTTTEDVRRMCRAGLIPHRRLSRVTFRFHRHEVEEWSKRRVAA